MNAKFQDIFAFPYLTNRLKSQKYDKLINLIELAKTKIEIDAIISVLKNLIDNNFKSSKPTLLTQQSVLSDDDEHGDKRPLTARGLMKSDHSSYLNCIIQVLFFKFFILFYFLNSDHCLPVYE